MSTTACYTVGQILYVIVKGRRALVPMQVTEEIRRTTQHGTIVRYAVRAACDSYRDVPEKEFELDESRYEVFVTVDAARSALKERFERHLDVILDEAVTLAQREFNTALNATVPAVPAASSEQEIAVEHSLDPNDKVMVEIPGLGRMQVRVNTAIS